jgi:murein tripeptide amidase MpaA
MKYIITLLIVLILLFGGYLFFTLMSSKNTIVQEKRNTPLLQEREEDLLSPLYENEEKEEGREEDFSRSRSIGTTLLGKDIEAYHFGNGNKKILLIGGIHGGYSPNTTLLMREFIEYFEKNENEIPSDVHLAIIPLLNPDGLAKVVQNTDSFTINDIKGGTKEKRESRFNSNGVDLNRNFDCLWEKEGIWQNTPVSGGENAFSENESRALKEYVSSVFTEEDLVLVYYAASGGVYPAECSQKTTKNILEENLKNVRLYGKASGYTVYEEFDSYEITGDLANYLAKESIPTISILLTDHRNTEFAKNKKGLDALFAKYK